MGTRLPARLGAEDLAAPRRDQFIQLRRGLAAVNHTGCQFPAIGQRARRADDPGLRGDLHFRNDIDLLPLIQTASLS